MNNWGEWSQWAEFQVPEAPVATPLSPIDTETGLRPTFEWDYEADSGEPQEAFQILIETQGEVPVYDTGEVLSSDHEWTPATNIPVGNLRWRVRVFDGDRWSEWSGWSAWDVVFRVPLNRTIKSRVEVLRRGEWIDVSRFLARAEVNHGDHTGVGVNPAGVDGVARTASITLKSSGSMRKYWPSTLSRMSDDLLGMSDDRVAWSADDAEVILNWLFGPSAGWTRENLAPRDRTSPVNLVMVDDEQVYDPLLWTNKEIRVWGRTLSGLAPAPVQEIIGDGIASEYDLPHAPIEPSTMQVRSTSTDPLQWEIDGWTGHLWLSRPLAVGETLTIDYATYSEDDGWKCDFHGVIGGNISVDGHAVKLDVVDLAKRPQTAYILDAADPPYEGPMEDVMQAILDDHPGTAGIKLYFPSGTESNPLPSNESPTWYVEEYAPAEMSVWDALGRLAARRGWFVGYRWHTPTEQMQLQLMAPPRWRNVTTANYRLSWMTDIYAHDLSDSDSQIVNYVEVVWRDKHGVEHTTVRQNQFSIDEYGLRAGRIREDNTNEINDAESAERLAQAVIDDLSDMRGASRVDMPVIPGMDVFTGIALDDPRVSSSEDFLGVENVLQIYDFEAGRFRTQINGPNRVVGGLLRWIDMIERPGGRRTATRRRPKGVVVVAAHDAGEYWRAIADYWCDGENDQETINEALNQGNKVELSEGTFHVSGSIGIEEGKTLSGQGKSTLMLVQQVQMGFLWGLIFTEGSDVTLKSLAIDGNYRGGEGESDLAAMVVEGDRVLISECAITDVGSVGIISQDASGLSVLDCDFHDIGGSAISIRGSDYPADVNDPDDYVSIGHKVANCSFTGKIGGSIGSMVSVRSSSDVLISNNTFSPDSSAPILTNVVACLGASIVGNTYKNATGALVFNSSVSSVATGNSFSGCVRSVVLGGCNHINIGGNTLSGGKIEGIELSLSDSCTVESNTIICQGDAGIKLYGSSDNYIQGNVIRKMTGKDLMVGIWLNDLDCKNNFITNNDLRNSGAIPIQDDGVGTIYTAGNQGV